jgi:hypothetical protein
LPELENEAPRTDAAQAHIGQDEQTKVTPNAGKLGRDFPDNTSMDYSFFRFEAVVDFIQVQVHTTARNQGWRLKRALTLRGISYVTPGQPDAAGWSSHFNMRLYDLRTYAALQSKLAAIEDEFPFESQPRITMIEVAFDGYLASPGSPTDRDQLAALTARMAFRLAEPVSDNRRIYRDGKGSPTAMPRTVLAVERKMAEGWNVGIGDKTGDRYQHAYLKTTDHNKEPIPTKDYRARFEIRIAGAALPHTEVESYRDFRFETLAEYICFRKEDEAASPHQRMIVAAYGDQASHSKNLKRRHGGGIRTAIMPRDEELNRIVRKRLQTLTKRWQRSAPGAQKGPTKCIIDN